MGHETQQLCSWMDLTWFGVKCEKAPCPEALSKTTVNLVADNQGRSTSQWPVVVILSMTLLDQKNTGVLSTYPPSLLIPNWSCLPFPLPSFLTTSTPHALSHVWLSVTPWTAVLQAPPSMEFLRQEYWSGLPFASPGDLPNLWMEPMSPALAGKFFITKPPGKLLHSLLTS